MPDWLKNLKRLGGFPPKDKPPNSATQGAGSAPFGKNKSDDVASGAESPKTPVRPTVGKYDVTTLIYSDPKPLIEIFVPDQPVISKVVCWDFSKPFNVLPLHLIHQGFAPDFLTPIDGVGDIPGQISFGGVIKLVDALFPDGLHPAEIWLQGPYSASDFNVEFTVVDSLPGGEPLRHLVKGEIRGKKLAD